MTKKIAVDFTLIIGVISFFITALLLSNYLHYGTFLF